MVWREAGGAKVQFAPVTDAPVLPGRGWLASLDAGVGYFIEVVGAILVAAEIAILFCGVVARYALNSPLVWSDELASALFLWLAMFGAAIALRRSEHMRLTVIVQMLPSRSRAIVEVIGLITISVFLLMLLVPSIEYAKGEWFIVSPALEFPNALRVGSIAVGTVFMVFFAVVRMVEQTRLGDAAIAIFVVATIALALYLLHPQLVAMGRYNLLIFFVLGVAFCIAVGVPVAFAFGVTTIAYIQLMTDAPLSVVVNRLDEGMSQSILISVPLFVALGVLLEVTGLAGALIAFLGSMLGHVRGGLSYVLLGAMYLVSGISGAKAADMAAVAPILLPEMKRRGCDPADLVSLLAASGAMSETIPPSLVLITIGSVTGVSIAALFTGGLLPALVLAVALGLVVWYRSRCDDLSGVTRAPFSTVCRTLLVALPALALPFVIRAAVVEGITTATEVATLGIAYTVLVGIVIYRKFDWRRVYPTLVATASLTGAILLIVGSATAMTWALVQSGFSKLLAQVIIANSGGSLGFLAISIVAFVVLGSILEGIPTVVLLGPMLFPIARAIGIHEVHYAMVIVLAMGVGLFAPPFGLGFYTACIIGKVSPDDAMGRIWIYLAALMVGLAVVVLVPWLSIGFLP